MYKICQVLGTPTKLSWADGLRLAENIGFKFPQCMGQSLASLVQAADADAIDLMHKMLQYDPARRPTASECLQHPFF